MLLLLPSAFGALLQVGPDRPFTTPCAAAAVAQDGDTVEIDASTYTGDVCFWPASNLTITGVGGYAVLDAAGEAAGGKGIWVIQGDDVHISWIEFTGATVPDQNGAGIRAEGTNLTIDHCSFHDNEDGILAGDDADSEITITNSYFADNGFGDGQSHNLYINHVKRLTFEFNTSVRAYVGHTLKSRAYESIIRYNVLADEQDGQGSYQINLPNGGSATIVGNVIQQGPAAENGGMVSFAEEGATNPIQSLAVVNNTFVNDRGSGTFITNTSTSDAVVTNNLFVGGGTTLDGPGITTTNLEGDATLFADGYHLAAGAAAIDAGSDPGAVLKPAYDPDGNERFDVGALDVGAYEWGDPPVTEDTGDAADVGCSCHTGKLSGVWPFAVFFALRRRTPWRRTTR